MQNFSLYIQVTSTVELQWLEHLWDYENLFEAGVVRAIEVYNRARSGGIIGNLFDFLQHEGIL